MSAAGEYARLIADPDPEAALRALDNDQLSALVSEIATTDRPNEYHAAVYARAMLEVLRRWRIETLIPNRDRKA